MASVSPALTSWPSATRDRADQARHRAEQRLAGVGRDLLRHQRGELGLALGVDQRLRARRRAWASANAVEQRPHLHRDRARRRPCRATPARPAASPIAHGERRAAGDRQRRRSLSPPPRPRPSARTRLAEPTTDAARARTRDRARRAAGPRCARLRSLEHVVDGGRPRRRAHARSRLPARRGWKPSGNSSAMKPVESWPARQRGCCHQRGEERDVVADALDGEGVERVAPARRSPPRASAHGCTSLAIIGS